MAIVKGKNANKPWTVRYRDSLGKQREKSFRTRKEADQFNADQTKAKAYGSDVNLSATRTAFTDAVAAWLTAEPWRNERTRENYVYAVSKWISAAYAGVSVREAASTPEIARKLINEDMLHLSSPVRSRARKIIVDTLNGLVENGTIQSHRLASLELAERKVTEDSHDNDGFVFITDDQVASLAKRVGVCVWLQRTMGLRIGEASGVETSDFINGGRTLRLTWQASLDGKTRVPLKKRKAGQFRDIPVPAFIQHMVADLPEGPLMAGMRSADRGIRRHQSS